MNLTKQEIKTFKLSLDTTLNCNHLDGVLRSWFFENISGSFGLEKLLAIQTNEQYFIELRYLFCRVKIAISTSPFSHGL